MDRPRPARPPVDRARGSGRPDRRSRTRPCRDGGVIGMDGLAAGIARTIDVLKAIGIDVGSYRLSLYSLFSTVIVAVLLYIAVRIAMRSTKWLLRRNSQIDATQRLLAEKLIAIALFVLDRKSTRLNSSH